ncbi:MAG: hypothetical protein AB1634_09960, partial [Thermodesulfobacteriota bacterium]
MARRPLLPVLLALLLVAPLPGYGQDAPRSKEVKRRPASRGSLDEQIQKQRQQSQRLAEEIRGQKGRLKTSERREHDILADLEGIDRRLNNERRRLGELKDALARQEKALAREEAALGTAQKEKAALASQVQRRLAVLYRTDPGGVLAVALASASLADLLSLEDAFHEVVRYDRNLLASYRKTIAKVDAARERAARERERAAEAVAQVGLQERALAQTRQDKRGLLAKVRTEKDLYQQALGELSAAAGELEATIGRLQAEQAR